MRSILLIALLVFFFRHDQPPVNGIVEGRVELGTSRIAQSGPRTQSRYQRQARPASAEASRTIPVLIFIEGNAPQPQQRSPQTTPPRLDQNKLQFEPRLVAVVAGQKVRIVNSDPVYHNVFSLSSVKRFDIGRRPTGEHVDVAFEGDCISTEIHTWPLVCRQI